MQATTASSPLDGTMCQNPDLVHVGHARQSFLCGDRHCQLPSNESAQAITSCDSHWAKRRGVLVPTLNRLASNITIIGRQSLGLL